MYRQAAHAHMLEAPALSALVDKSQRQMMAARCVCTGKKCDTIFGLESVTRSAPPENKGVMQRHSPVLSAL